MWEANNLTQPCLSFFREKIPNGVGLASFIISGGDKSKKCDERPRELLVLRIELYGYKPTTTSVKVCRYTR